MQLNWLYFCGIWAAGFKIISGDHYTTTAHEELNVRIWMWGIECEELNVRSWMWGFWEFCEELNAEELNVRIRMLGMWGVECEELNVRIVRNVRSWMLRVECVELNVRRMWREVFGGDSYWTHFFVFVYNERCQAIMKTYMYFAVPFKFVHAMPVLCVFFYWTII